MIEDFIKRKKPKLNKKYKVEYKNNVIKNDYNWTLESINELKKKTEAEWKKLQPENTYLKFEIYYYNVNESNRRIYIYSPDITLYQIENHDEDEKYNVIIEYKHFK